MARLHLTMPSLGTFLVTPLVVLTVAVALTCASPPARAQSSDLRPLQDRIERLQRDVDVLQRQLARPGSAPAASSAGGGASVSGDFIGRTEDRFSSVDEQIRDLTNRVEQLTHQIGEASTRLDKLVADIDFRLGALEKGTAARASDTSAATSAPAASPPAQAQQPGSGQRLVLVPGGPAGGAPAPAAAAAAPVELPQGSPEAQYEFAYGLLLQAQAEQAEFGRAEQGLRAFVSTHPSHRLAGNAQYWLGETYYARRDYQNAAATFAEGLQKYPRSDKAPDNMLKLGMSLGQLNRKPEACGTLAELGRRHPNATASVKQAATREQTRLACPK